MLSSKGDKSEAKFATRLDVLAERVDTLASTVATTASAMAKRDGEIAALRKELDARDQRLASLLSQSRDAGDGADLRELKQAVAALANERATNAGPAGEVDDLTAKVTRLAQRLETVSATVSTTAAGLAGRDGELAALRKRLESAPMPGPGSPAGAPDPALTRRIGDLAADVMSTRVQLQDLADETTALREQLAQQVAADTSRPSEEIREMLGALRAKVEQLGELTLDAASEQLDERLTRTDESVARLTGRVDTLATAIDSAVAGIAEKEKELAELHSQFTASSGRIESIAEDIRDALSAFPEVGSVGVDDLALHVERMEAASRERAESQARLVGELSRRLETIEARVTTVASEVARAKALWPVALRSLEARLDDVVSHARSPAESAPEAPDTAGDGADDDLLAGLRDSLQAMETVAAEMARASDVLAPADELPAAPEAVAAAGATIVPLRSSDP